MAVQLMMATGRVEYVWSFMLDIESLKNPVEQRRKAVRKWRNGASLNIRPSSNIRERARDIMNLGVKPQDAIHLACAEVGKCDCFLTVDAGILKKVQRLGEMKIINPVAYFTEGEQ